MAESSLPRMHVRFCLILPLGQFLVFSALIAIFCGPENLITIPTPPSDEPETSYVMTIPPQPPTIREKVADQARRSTMFANLPGGLVQIPVMRYTEAHPKSAPWIFRMMTCNLLSWSVLAMPFWWMAGRALDAMFAARRGIVRPRLHWAEAIIAFVLLAIGSFAIIGWIGNIVRGERELALLGLCSLLWSFIGALILRARVLQRRLSRTA